MNASRQLVLEIAPPPAFGDEDFLVAPSNETAWNFVQAWPDWPDRTLLLLGPPGSGKSHLAAIWARRADAIPLTGRNLPRANELGRLAGRHVIVEEASETGEESALFHLINLAGENQTTVLLTACLPPEAWPQTLRDLQSRLRRAIRADLGMPDDALVRAILVKLLGDRQLLVEADVVEFVARRLERSLAATRDFIAALDREALARGRRIGRGLAGDVLRRLETETAETVA